MNFSDLLKRAGITKAELSRRLGIKRGTIYHWDKAPLYAIAYLELLIECNRWKP
jgi:DNA-binding XRE family transcriptional regulator